MRAAAKGERQQVLFFFFKSKFTFFSHCVSHVCRQGTPHAAQDTVANEAASDASLFLFHLIFWGFFQKRSH